MNFGPFWRDFDVVAWFRSLLPGYDQSDDDGEATGGEG